MGFPPLSIVLPASRGERGVVRASAEVVQGHVEVVREGAKNLDRSSAFALFDFPDGKVRDSRSRAKLRLAYAMLLA